MKRISGSEPAKKRICLLCYSEGRPIKSIVGVDPEQALFLIEILEQPRQIRLECGAKLAKCLDELRKKGLTGPDDGILMSVTTKAGIVKRISAPIYWRIAVFAMGNQFPCKIQVRIYHLTEQLDEAKGLTCVIKFSKVTTIPRAVRQ